MKKKKFNSNSNNKFSIDSKLIDFESNIESQSKYVNDQMHEILIISPMIFIVLIIWI